MEKQGCKKTIFKREIKTDVGYMVLCIGRMIKAQAKRTSNKIIYLTKFV